MLQERIEAKWIAAVARVFALCDVKSGEAVAVLSETQSRPVLAQLSELALASVGARPFHVVVPTPPQRAPVPVRSTGASDALGNLEPVVTALAQAALVVDCTAARTANGRLVLAPGDVNLTFKRYVESPISLTIEHDTVVEVAGDGLDALLMRSYFAAWGDKEACAVSHVGWGMIPAARWDAMAMYDRRDFNGTELRAFAGNVLYSTGANEVAGRRTLGHFDLPLRHCTVRLDGVAVVEASALQGELA